MKNIISAKINITKLIILTNVCVIVFFNVLNINAAGQLDLSFGIDGKVETVIKPKLIKQDRFGNILIAGDRFFTISKYHPDGSPDLLFGVGGTANASGLGNSETFAMEVQSNGKIVLVGFTKVDSITTFSVVRFNTDGALDNTFAQNGVAFSQFDNAEGANAKVVKIQEDGKLVVAGLGSFPGRRRYVVARYNYNGTLDNSFGNQGKTIVEIGRDDFAFALGIQSDGKILVGGYSLIGTATGEDLSLVRLMSNGNLDSSFGINGRVTTNVIEGFDRGYHISIQNDGKIILGGDCWTGSTYTICAARYNTDGTLDSSFDSDGIRVSTVSSHYNGLVSLIISSSQKIIFIGQGYNGSLDEINGSRYRYDGSLDSAFGNGGIFKTIFNNSRTSPVSATLTNDGKILVAGTSGNANIIARYLDDSVALQPYQTYIDFDGDNKTDISIFRPTLGQWWYLRSSDNANRAFQFGSSTDKIVPADYTGDGKTDIATFTPSTGFWNILRSEDSTFFGFPFGASGDIAAPADYDGDGKADAAVFRPSNSTWFISKSSGGTTIQQFGASGDAPAVADYDGDGRADLAIYRVALGQWWYVRSSDGTNRAFQFGTATDKPLQGDYTGDGKADLAFFRPSTGQWFILRSEDSTFYGFPFGASGDIAASGDYDGDGRFDAAVFRPTNTTWFINRSTAGTQIVGFGANGDIPVPSAFVP